ncbi:acetyltransferase (GNAT) family protein [Chitinophaga skermanii]|uniref:Acetyltransferase (GNAT) family protein n=1 Tax=Chitinophaga skermanii TaxID=331697 RepID=A0A327QLA5_9BACT|nr:GNAT family N-acetyltransferase [Chitinophaga skermanii]RAJ05101.1 acetyltransferase (GNAT) family protein [Chitinophaga skermanii]
MGLYHVTRGKYTVSDDRTKLDLDIIHAFLSNTYWAKNIPHEIIEKSIINSMCFGVYEGEQQVGFARVVTDRATFAYLADVFILESHRGLGLSKFLMEVIMEHRDLQGLRRWMLATRDAHGLYEQFGFMKVEDPTPLMVIHNSNIYQPKE